MMLRASLNGIQYRVLYFFHGNTAVILSHGVVKEREVPEREIERAILRRIKYQDAPENHAWEG